MTNLPKIAMLFYLDGEHVATIHGTQLQCNSYQVGDTIILSQEDVAGIRMKITSKRTRKDGSIKITIKRQYELDED